MKQKTGKFLSLMLSLALLCGLCVPPVSAAESRYSDTQGHWAEAAIERWSGYGVIQGYGDTFSPDASVTRAQMAVVLSNTLGLTETSGNPFSDVAEDAWYAPYVLRCYAAGIMAGDNGRANPDAVITRQEAMVMLSRTLGIAPEGNPDLSAFVDGAQVSGWAAPYVAAMVKSGIVSGVGNGRLDSGGIMNRASLVTVLDQAVVQYIQSPGSYELADEDGLVLIAAGDVTLSGETSANILVTPAADGRTVTFDKAVVTGDITVQADDAKVTVKDSKLPDIALTGEGSKVTENKSAAESSGSSGSHGGGGGSHGGGGGSSTPDYSSLTITESKTVSSGTYQNVTITDAVGDGDVTLSGLTIRGNLYIYGGGSNFVKLDGCTILGKIIMAKASGQPPRLYLCQTPVSTVEVQTPAIVEAADAASAVTAVEAKADIEIKGEQTAVAAVTVPVTAEAPVAVTVTAGTVSKVEAKGETAVSGAESSIDCVVAEAAVTVDSAAVTKVEVPASAEDVVVNVQGTAAIEVEVNSSSTTVTAENTDHITVSGAAKDSVTAHTHVWNEGEVTKAATCAEEGVKTYTCTAANCPVGTKSEAIAKTEHTPVTDKAVEADCLTDGKTEGTHCSVCGAVIQAQETVPALGHDFTGAYTSDGTGHWHTCTRCDAAGEKETHTYNTATCDEAANCTVCGYEKAAGEHIWNEGEVTKAATCTEAGVKTYTCTVCKATKTEEIAATGHTEVIDPAVAPTCTETGLTEGKHCSVCNIVITAQETVAANGHTWDEGVVTTEPTGETEGVRTYTCTVCGGTKTETIPAASAGNAWITAYPASVQLNWTPKPDYDGYYYVNGSNVGSSSSKNLNADILSCAAGNTLSYTIETDNGSEKELWIEISDIVNVEKADGTPDITITGQEDGSYLFTPNNGYAGIYGYALKTPEGDTILQNSLRSGVALQYVAPYDGCTFEVSEVSWEAGTELEHLTVKISESGIFSFTPYNFSGVTATVTNEAEFSEAMNRGGTVTLGNDFEINNCRITRGGDVTLDLNGHTITLIYNAMSIEHGKNVKIIDSVGGGAILGTQLIVSSGSSLTCEGGEYAGINSGAASGYAQVRSVTLTNVTADVNLNRTEYVTISGGAFTSLLVSRCVDVMISEADMKSLTLSDCPNVQVSSCGMEHTLISNGTSATFSDVTMAGTMINGLDVRDSTLVIENGSYNCDPSAYVDTEIYDIAQDGDGNWIVTAKAEG